MTSKYSILMSLLNPSNLILFFLLITLTHSFTSGIVRLTPSSSLSSSSYSLLYLAQTNSLIISLSSFSTSTGLTSCQIIKNALTGANFSCTSNVEIISYLYFEKNPMGMAGTYGFYFFEENQEYEGAVVIQKAGCLVERPILKAVLTGLAISKGDFTKVQIATSSDSWTVKVSRTLNVKAVNISYILFQALSPYNLTFTDASLQPFDSQFKLTRTRSSYLNFYGIQTLSSVGSSLNSSINVSLELDPSMATESNILSINQINLSKNVYITGLFVSASLVPCLYPLVYSPSQSKCIQTCSLNTIQTTFQQYCTNRTYNSSYSYSQNNLQDQFTKYGQIGCLQNSVKTIQQRSQGLYRYDTECFKCKEGFKMYQGRCVCPYAMYLNGTVCKKCSKEGQQCALDIDVTGNYEVKQAGKVTIVVNIQLPAYEKYEGESDEQFVIQSLVNGVKYSSRAIYSPKEQQITVEIENVSSSKGYNVSCLADYQNDNNLFLISRASTQFLWTLPNTTILSLSPAISSEQVLQTAFAPVFSQTDKSLPLVLFIAFLLGDKINTFSIFQTVSIIYLVNFMNIGQQYEETKELLMKIFIFQPKPIFNVIGSQEESGEIRMGRIDKSVVSYDEKIWKYTQGRLFIEIAVNQIVSLMVQIGGIIGCLQIAKRLLRRSNNQVVPTSVYTKIKGSLDFSRSKTDTNGHIKWLSQPQVHSSAPFRFKFFIFISNVCTKKWIVIFSLLSTQLLSLSFLALHQLTLPVYTTQLIISRIACFTVLAVLICLPLAFMKEEALTLFKCWGCAYKRTKKYKRWELWIGFFFKYSENLVFSVIMLCIDGAVQQISCMIGLQVLKLVYFRQVLKKLQSLRTLALIGFFGTVLAAALTEEAEKTDGNIQALMSSLLVVLGVQVLRIIRGVIIAILRCFKEKGIEPKVDDLKNKKQNTNKQSKKTTVVAQNIKKKKTMNEEEPDWLRQARQAREARRRSQIEKQNIEPHTDASKMGYKSKAFRRHLANKN